MRTLSYLLLLLSFVLTACEKNGDGSYDLPKSTDGTDELVGTWALKRYDSESSGTTTYQGLTFDMDATGTLSALSNYRLTFTSDGSVTGVGDIIVDIQANVGGQVMNNQSPGTNLFASGTYELKGDIITYTDASGNRSETELTTLTDTELVFEGVVDTEYTMAGMVNQATVHYVQAFERVQ